MKKIMVLMVLLALSSTAFAGGTHPAAYPPPPPPPYPYPGQGCTMMYPGQTDRNNRHCVNPSAFGVAYEGYFFSDTPCFPSAYEAENALRNEYACRQPSDFGYCRLANPGQIDRNNRHCVNPTAWGVTYDGYFFSDSPCFQSVGEAMRAMQNNWSCRNPPYQGRCSLVNPGQIDRGNRHCVNPTAWGLAYNGFFISDSPCHTSMDEAMRRMQREPACR